MVTRKKTTATKKATVTKKRRILKKIINFLPYAQTPRGKKRSAQVLVNLYPEEKADIEALAQRMGLRNAQLVRVAMMRGLSLICAEQGLKFESLKHVKCMNGVIRHQLSCMPYVQTRVKKTRSTKR